jgi:hypothetical protein
MILYKSKLIPGNGKEYAETHFVSGHFIFGTSDFYKEIIPDPRLLFFGEEHTTGLRAWTNGFRIFSIKENVLWHLGKTKEYFRGIGADNWRNPIISDAAEIKLGNLGNYRDYYNNILKGLEYGPLAAKDEESYIEYLRAIGFDYRTRKEFD